MPCCFVLFHKPDFELSSAESLLTGHGLSVVRQQNHLLVRWGEGPEFRVFFASGDEVQSEAEEIGSCTSLGAELSGLDMRFEIAFDDLDEVLDEINTLIEVQLCL